MEKLLQDKKILFVGNCGLDLSHNSRPKKEHQIEVLRLHFDLAQKFNKPMYFQSRSASVVFLSILKENRHKFKNGLMHSFTGTLTDMHELIKLNMFIGISGSTLKRSLNSTKKLLRSLPLNLMIIESSSPFCGFNPGS